MTPGPDGTVFVAIPRAAGTVLAPLDRGGRPRQGWPITVKDSTSCGLLLPLGDGSVRVVCNGTDLPQFDIDPSDVRAFAFDVGGRPIAGWPAPLRPGWPTASTVAMVGEELTVLQEQVLSDTFDPGTVSHEAWLTTVGPDGGTRDGTRIQMAETCCGERWAVGPDGIGYRVVDGERTGPGVLEVSHVTAVDRSGIQASWPVRIGGIASEPAFARSGSMVLTVGSAVQSWSRLLVFDREGESYSTRSAQIPIATVESGVDCIAAIPKPPIIAVDGTIFVYSELDTAVLAVTPGLRPIPGWPFEPSTPLERPDPARGQDGLNCTTPAPPAVGPDGTLFMPLAAQSPTVGGSIVAVDRDARVRPGWPVELKRPGSEFWSVVVGSDGTAFALAIEPESSKTSSASIVAIAPDSTVLYTTTIIDP